MSKSKEMAEHDECVKISMEIEEPDESVKITLHCVGVAVMPRVGACLFMMQTTSPSGLYCVLLTVETSDLVSPLYEHTLVLKKQASVENDTLIAQFTGESVFVVQQRLTCRYRLDAQFTSKELAKRLRELVGNTFFLDMDRSFTPMRDDAITRLTPLFTTFTGTPVRFAYFDCTQKEDADRVQAHLNLYHQCQEKRYRNKKPLYDNYWLEVITSQKNALDTAMTHLLMYAKANCLYQKSDILVLFKGWKQYKAVASYFVHRTQSIEYTYALHKTLHGAPPLLINQLWVMSCDKRTLLYQFCCGLMRRLMTTDAEFDVDVNVSLFEEILPGHLYTVLSLLIKQQERLRQERLIEKLKLPMLAYCVARRLETQALGKVKYTQASLDAVTVQLLYTAYHLFTSVQPPLELTTADVIDLESDDDPIPSTENDSESEEPTVDIEEWVHNLKDFGRLVRYMYTVQRHSGKWIFKPQKTTLLIAKTVLFFIAPFEQTLTLEKENAIIIDRYLHGKALVSLHFHESSPIKHETWQQEWNNLKETIDHETGQQQYQFVLFNPLELMRNEDLACIKTMLFADLFNTSILRETSDIFFLKRLSHYFAENQTKLKMNIFHSEHCIGSGQFVTIREDAIKETVIVPQCHLLSLGGMRNLLQWFLLNKDVIKRIVMIGSPFMLPCLAHGQAFLDLLRTLEPRSINRPLYDKTVRNEELITIINKHWRVLKCDTAKQLTTLQQQEKLFKEGGCRSLYLFKNESLFVNMIEPLQERAQLYCLCKCGKQLAESVNKVLSAKLKTRFNVEAMEIDRLCTYNCVPIEASRDFFLITKQTLFNLDKNQFFYVFMLLDKLIVIESPELRTKGDLLVALIENIKERTKPNLRYSYVSTQQ